MNLPNTPLCIYPGVSQYNGASWLKLAMRWAYNIDYIHAWVGFKLGGIPLVYHSTGFGVHVKDWESFLINREIKHMWEVQLSAENFLSFAQKSFKETGKKYANSQLMGIGVVKFLEICSGGRIQLKKYPKIFRPNRETEQVCSESAGRMIVQYTSASWDGRDPDLYTPKDFVDTCLELETLGEAIKIL